MASIHLMMPLIVATVAANSYGYNMAATTSATQQQHYDNHRWLPLAQESLARKSAEHSSGGLEAILNGLSNLSSRGGHISNGYGSVAPTHTEALAMASSKQEIPIYEEQHEDAAVAAVAATAGDYGAPPAGEQHSNAAAIYDYTGGAGAGAAAGASGGASGGYLPDFGDAEQQYKEALQAQIQQQQQQQHQEQGLGQSHGQGGHHYAYDKISVGNYLNHYDQGADSGYDAYQQHHADEQHYQQQHQQQQQQHLQQQQQLEHASSYYSSSSAAGGPHDYEDHPDGNEQSSNFLADSSGHHVGSGPGDGAQAHSHQSHHHVDIINYVPVKHVKKEHVPVEKPVKIPVSHAVIIPIKKPVPIHIPITKQVQVPIHKELKVPVERIIPVPVEKHIPVPVEKKVPFHVIKYVPIKVPKPFPVKVPVFKTVLHKVKGWW